MKNQKTKLSIFKGKEIRRVWSEEDEKWYFGIVDIVSVLTESIDPGAYWRKLKERLKIEGNQSVTKCHSFKLLAKDGKRRNFDMADIEILFRIIQSIPSKKAEPFKLWLAKVGHERIEEVSNPEKAIDRARKNWLELGRSKKWIEQRMRGQETRNKLTDYWSEHEVSEEDEFARLTNIIHREWSGVTIKAHKKIKDLKNHNLRDNMTEAELIFTTLAELSTRQVAKKDKAEGYDENSVAASKGGKYAGKARVDFEKLTGNKVVSRKNFLASEKKKKRLKK